LQRERIFGNKSLTDGGRGIEESAEVSRQGPGGSRGPIIAVAEDPYAFVMVEEVVFSIRQSKRQVLSLLRPMAPGERAALVRRMIREAMDEEIEQAIRVRKNRCLRCVNVRYYDRTGTAFVNLPVGFFRRRALGVTRYGPPGWSADDFSKEEGPLPLRLSGEITLLYELRKPCSRSKRYGRTTS